MPGASTKIIKARFNYSGISAERMLRIGENLNDSMKSRIKRAVTALDEPAKPLKAMRDGNPTYAKAKINRGIPGVRNWIFTGGTLSSMVVKSVSSNQGTIGFVGARANLIAHVNNVRERAFGVSPSDRKVLQSSVKVQVLQSLAGPIRPVNDVSGLFL